MQVFCVFCSVHFAKRGALMARKSGVLLHITSLPSKYGIGTLGKDAYRFADFLHAAGQSCWQLLPLGQTSYGDSPYQTFSTYAGNPYLIDLELLAEDGLLLEQELAGIDFGGEADRVDYAQLYRVRYDILYKAYARGWKRDRDAVRSFQKENPWLRDYALYMAIKRSQDMQSWEHWPEPLRRREKEALKDARARLRDDIQFFTYLQLLFFRQWRDFKNYVNRLDIQLIGDIPIYVPYDSADVWANPNLFQLDERLLPAKVAGVPPDGFTADGQLWGNPLYDWPQHRKTRYKWWLGRIRACKELVDVVRIDHFRGLESYWAVPYGDTTARGGAWVKGPGTHFVRAIKKAFPDYPLIAEDLGFLTPAVRRLLKYSGYPGMKVLQFAFDPREESDYLPHRYCENCVCYPGTHDNETLRQWIGGIDRKTARYAMDYLGVQKKAELFDAIIAAGMNSKADTFIVPMQDLLHLGKPARMNLPGTLSTDNWSWRLKKRQITNRLAERLLALTKQAGRAG